MTWYPAEPVDESFFAHAPVVHRYPVELPVPPARVWESLTSDRALAEWGLPLTVTWTSPRPFGIGTTRTVTLPLRAVTVHEHYFRWDEGRRKAFFVTEADRPLLASFAEEYLLEPTETGCRFTWTLAIAPAPRAARLLRAADPVTALVGRAVPAAAKRYYTRHPVPPPPA